MTDLLRDPVSIRTRRLLLWTAGLCAATFFGAVVTGRLVALVLVWNLFLAWVPYVMSRGIVRMARGTRHGTGLLVLPTALWLLFFPNAPYIVTDLVHVPRIPALLMVPGALMIAAFAALAMSLGLYSLYDMHRIVRRRLGARWGWSFVTTVVFLAAIGVWMGRVLRWNSWDALRHPTAVLRSTLEGLARSPNAAVFVLVMAAGMLLLYRGAINRRAG